MVDRIKFRVAGVPVPQGSKVIGRTKEGKTFMREHKANELAAWRRAIGYAAKAAMAGRDPFEEPMHVYYLFEFPRPKRPKYSHPAGKPDLDKLQRAANDAMTGIVFRDDALIVHAAPLKKYADDRVGPGLYIEATPMRDE